MKVFTNGCFDLFHEGHKYFLKEASKLGDLIVGVDSDKSVRQVKGKDRPINPDYKRFTDVVRYNYPNETRYFHHSQLEKLLIELRIKIYVKGDDYTEEQLRKELPNYKGEIVIIPRLPGISTTEIINEKNSSLW
jgi:rfaE bifunctional protein nucleotidyltransferase chain/domain